MNGSEFGGVTARYYARFRRGYPGLVVDRLVQVLGLDAGSRVLDLGGLTSGVDNVAWLLAADSDLHALGTLLGRGTLDAITVGCAFHWMDPATLIAAARDLMRAGGRVAVVTNGVADWEHDTPWAAVLRDTLAARFGGPVRGHTGTGVDSQQALVAALAAAGFTDVGETVVDYVEQRTVEQLIGSLYSAMSAGTGQRSHDDGFEADLADALADVAVDGRLTADVTVKILTATTG